MPCASCDRSRVRTSKPQLRRLLYCCVAVSALCARVHAQVPAASVDTAREAQRDGDRLRDAGDLRGALDRYTVAHAVLAAPTSGLRLAETQAALGLLVEARQTAAATSAIPARQAEPNEFAQARKAARQLAAEIEPRLAVFEVTISPDTPYTLRIDGSVLPENMHGLRFRANPGDHLVEVEAPGFQLAKQSFTLAEGAYQLFLISLSREVAPTPAPPPPVVAESQPSTPPARELQPTAVARRAPLREDPAVTAQRTRGYIALGVSGAALATGIIAGMVSFIATSNAKPKCVDDVCPRELRSKLDTADTLANVANIALPIGLLGAAYGAYELLTISESSGLQVQIDSRGAYAGWRGRL
jgi:hypothetical protein